MTLQRKTCNTGRDHPSAFMLLLFLALLLLLPLHAQDFPPLPERTALTVQVLSRMDKSVLEQNDRLKETLATVLKQTRGRPEFVQLVKQFDLTDQNTHLIDIATTSPEAEHGVTAIKLLLSNETGTDVLRRTLQEGNPTNTLPLIHALGNSADKRTHTLLQPFISTTNAALDVRKAAVKAQVRTWVGAQAVILTAINDTLPSDVKFTATTALAAIRWDDLRTQAAEVLPPPQGQNARPLPPLAELLKQKGDPARGAKVFANETSQCANCHVIRDRGTDVGPNLSEIGGKLGKDALYESILDPSAGIAFNYEAWEVILHSDDEAFGLLISETADEIAIKDPRAIVTRYKKSDIESRRQMTLSLMPSGLQLTMSTQDLIDLVEYLASLKK